MTENLQNDILDKNDIRVLKRYRNYKNNISGTQTASVFIKRRENWKIPIMT